jgi:hypothetical protein
MKRLMAFSTLASLVLSASAFAQEEFETQVPAPVYGAVDAPVDSVEEAPMEAKISPPLARQAVKEDRNDKLPELNPSQMSPEMYLYLQEQQRHDDPKQAIRRKAEARTAAREARIAAMKWYGMSNARPQVNPVPFTGSYSPAWIGNGRNNYNWYGLGWPSVSLRVDQSYELQR